MSRFKNLAFQLLAIPRIRFWVCKWRYNRFKGRMKFLEGMSSGVSDFAVEHNFGAMRNDAAFGMGGRMGLLLHPVAGLLGDQGNLQKAKVLIVGPRTEDDIFMAWSIGMRAATGLDLFSYSPYIALGDMHKTDYADNTFDAVVLGWVLAYSTEPERMLKECRRIIKPGGFLAIGLAVYPPKAVLELGSGLKRGNAANSIEDLLALANDNKPIATFAPPPEEDATNAAVVFKIRKQAFGETLPQS